MTKQSRLELQQRAEKAGDLRLCELDIARTESAIKNCREFNGGIIPESVTRHITDMEAKLSVLKSRAESLRTRLS